MTPTVPDGPDTELVAAIAWFRADEAMIRDLEAGNAGFMAQHHAATIVRAVLARPAAGRDLTAQDVGVALDGVTHLSRQIRDEVARELNGIARPAVARTDGPLAEGPEYAIIETNRGGGVEYPVAERNTNGATGWMVGGEFVPESAVTHVAPVNVTRGARGTAPADDTAPLRDDLAHIVTWCRGIARKAEGQDMPDLAMTAPVIAEELDRALAGRPLSYARPAPTDPDVAELLVWLRERGKLPADDTAAPDHPLPWRRDGNSYLRSIVDANDVRVGWMHPPDLAAALVKAVNQWGRRAIGVPVAVLDALPDRDPFADESPAAQPVRGSQPEATDG